MSTKKEPKKIRVEYEFSFDDHLKMEQFLGKIRKSDELMYEDICIALMGSESSSIKKDEFGSFKRTVSTF